MQGLGEGFGQAVRKRFHHFRRFAIGFYDPAFRQLWFTPNSRFGIYGAIVSVLAGNWRPSLLTRVRIGMFFVIVAMIRLFRKGERARVS